jgi:hypothetical protein
MCSLPTLPQSVLWQSPQHPRHERQAAPPLPGLPVKLPALHDGPCSLCCAALRRRAASRPPPLAHRIHSDIAPWRRPDAAPSSFFNYGMTEKTWRQYQAKVQQYQAEFVMARHVPAGHRAEEAASSQQPRPPSMPPSAAAGGKHQVTRCTKCSWRLLGGAQGPGAGPAISAL